MADTEQSKRVSIIEVCHRCPDCGRRMHVEPPTGHEGTTWYWHCWYCEAQRARAELADLADAYREQEEAHEATVRAWDAASAEVERLRERARPLQAVAVSARAMLAAVMTAAVRKACGEVSESDKAALGRTATDLSNALDALEDTDE